jgi:protocatechuate 3,4-dioxygenase beta subunit
VHPDELTRRRFLGASVAASLSLGLAACDGGDGGGATTTQAAPRSPDEARRPPTPACQDGDEATVEQTEGPFFVPDSPERRSLVEPGLSGTPVVLAGRVLTTDCRPVRRALLDFWQADGRGEYDNDGFRLRGHQFTDAKGRYLLRTVMPGNYQGRTRHIHVKAQPRGGRVLTTQLYFPGESRNASDPIFSPELLVEMRGRRASFDFVLEA